MPRPITLFLCALALAPELARGATNLVVNGRFDADISSWTLSGFGIPPLPAVTSWSALDELGKPGSGSLHLSNFQPDIVAYIYSNCFAVTPGKPIVFGASAHGPFGAPSGGHLARTSLTYSDAPNCAGNSLDQVNSDLHYSLGASTWGPSQGFHLVPAGAQSALLKVRISTLGVPPSDLYVDNAFVYQDESCATTANVVCLNDRRFRVHIRWSIPDGTQGYGALTAFTGDSARASFFAPANVEAVLKVLDGCEVNERYWVFAAGLTNVAVTTVITDTHTGEVWEHENPLDQAFAPVQDTSAFADCPH